MKRHAFVPVLLLASVVAANLEDKASDLSPEQAIVYLARAG
jgi:hypothetical protein